MAELAELLEGHVSVALAHRGLQPWRLRREAEGKPGRDVVSEVSHGRV